MELKGVYSKTSPAAGFKNPFNGIERGGGAGGVGGGGATNPFNGIESLSIVIPLISISLVQNPFNGIERLDLILVGCMCILDITNPFNGIERELF